jgi:hypothetical protein
MNKIVVAAAIATGTFSHAGASGLPGTDAGQKQTVNISSQVNLAGNVTHRSGTGAQMSIGWSKIDGPVEVVF